jgi:YbbR domain-containing protein
MKDANGNYEISISNIQADAGNTKKAKITVKLNPKVVKQQRVLLLLNDHQPTSVPVKAYSFNAEPRTSDTDTIEFLINMVEPGDYLVRVQVDGAESLLDVDANTGQYIDPKVTVP